MSAPSTGGHKAPKTNLGFQIPLEETATTSGHIDALQIPNGAIHVLDYKPNAIKKKPIEQLIFYPLALSRRTGLRLYDFKCAWFDEKHYFEFFPLHVVLKKGAKPSATMKITEKTFQPGG